MLSLLFKKDKALSLIVWSLFSFSMIQVLSIFIYTINNNLTYFLFIAGLYASLFFLYYFIFKVRFGSRLKYLQFLVSNILFTMLVLIFAYGYYRLIMLKNDPFNVRFNILILVLSIIFGSILFLFTLIKKR